MHLMYFFSGVYKQLVAGCLCVRWGGGGMVVVGGGSDPEDRHCRTLWLPSTNA